MNFYMEASIENLKALKDLDYELSDIAEYILELYYLKIQYLWFKPHMHLLYII